MRRAIVWFESIAIATLVISSSFVIVLQRSKIGRSERKARFACSDAWSRASFALFGQSRGVVAIVQLRYFTLGPLARLDIPGDRPDNHGQTRAYKSPYDCDNW